MDTTAIDMNETLITLTSDIVAAHVSNNDVPVDQLSVLISSVYGALAGLGAPAPAPEAAPEPAVSVRSSVKNDHIVCLEDGKKLKMLKRHLMTHYNMTPAEYRTRWSLPADYPMVAPAYAERRRELAKKIGLGRKPGTKMPPRVKPADAPVKVPARRGRPPKAKV
jgi:predicted transcriptional regulator